MVDWRKRYGMAIFFANAAAMAAYPAQFGWMSGPKGGGAVIHVQDSTKNTKGG